MSNCSIFNTCKLYKVLHYSASVNLGALGSAGFKAGFFSGISNNTDARLYGKTWLGIALILNQEIASVSFSRENLDGRFHGETRLDVLGTNYVNEIQYTCNVTVDDWHFTSETTLPAFRIVFSGFSFMMNADVNVGIRLNFWPSHCGDDGEMGARFQPYAFFEIDAYSELENDVSPAFLFLGPIPCCTLLTYVFCFIFFYIFFVYSTVFWRRNSCNANNELLHGFSNKNAQCLHVHLPRQRQHLL